MSKPYRPWVAAAAAVTLLAALYAPSVPAETIVVGDQVMVRQSEVPRPKGGMSMDEVQKHFGEPRERHAAVGTPPITRWDYDGFAVFFEKDRVIDAVVPNVASPTASPPEAAPIPVAAPAAASPGLDTANVEAPQAAPAPASPASPAASTPKSAAPPRSDVSLHH